MSFRPGFEQVPRTQSTPFDLPGLTLPLTFKPERHWRDLVYGNALDTSDIQDGYVSHLFVVRELTMMRIMETITEKPNWEEKVFNEEITAKWREEAVDGENVTEAMMDFIIAELRWKTDEYKQTGMFESFDPGVVKSDTAIPRDIQQRLQDLARSLEQEGPKDYHPNSDDKVVDLVHPSLFPLVYGRSKVLTDKLIGTDDCFLNVGLGELTKVQDVPRRGWNIDSTYSSQFQWLPCEVKFDNNGECQIASYINNLHPAKYRDLYRVIEQILTRTIPLWNKSLTSKFDTNRIAYTETDYLPSAEPEPEWTSDDEEDEDDYHDRHHNWRNAQQPKHPDAPTFSPPVDQIQAIPDLQAKYADKGLQVIVKLANTELTPENPNYDGGSWHIEGQLNERICATAIYYYDCENITDNTLSFRHRADERFFEDFHDYEQGQFAFLRVFGFEPGAGHDGGDDDFTQHLGGVSCREGRLLTFPNTLQHCVSPFSLADPSKPGHRKILAFFLIDPTRRIISTANVPPQREDWCSEWKDSIQNVLGRRLPVELQDMVMSDLDSAPMTMAEAKEYRIKLMEERSAKSTEANQRFELGGFNLCEH